jgi:hypothetical protein
MLHFQVFKKLKIEYNNKKPGNRHRRFGIGVFVLPALVVGAVALGVSLQNIKN